MGFGAVGLQHDGRAPSSLAAELRNSTGRAGAGSSTVCSSTTCISALAIRIADSRGTIEVGKQATLLVLADDPTASVVHLAKPEFVLVRGVLWSGAELRDVARPVRPLPAFPTAAK